MYNPIIPINLGHDTVPTISIPQFDTGRIFNLYLENYIIPNNSDIRIYVLKPSGHEVFNSCTFVENLVSTPCTLQMLAEIGNSSALIQIISDGTYLTSFPFTIQVTPNPMAHTSVESSDEFNVLDDLIIEARAIAISEQDRAEAENKRVENESNRCQAELLRVNEYNAIKTDLETVKTTVITQGNNAEAKGIVAEKKGISAETKGNIAQLAADNANTAANRANEASDVIEQANIKPLAYSVSGESITAGNSAEKPLIGLTVHGRADQGSTTGAQLFDESKLPTKTQGGATITNNNDGSFTVSGSGTLTERFLQTFYYSHEETLKLIKAGKIYLSGLMHSLDSFAIHFKNNRTVYTQLNFNTKETEITEEMLNDSDFHMLLIEYISKGAEIIPQTVKPMLYQKGNGTWEPYTGGAPSPSTEYPQEFDIAGNSGSISVNVAGANLFDISKVQSISLASGAQTTNNNDGTLSVQSSQTGTSGGYEDGKNVLRDLCPELRVGDVVVLSAISTGSDKRIYLRGSRYLWASGTSRTISETDLDSIVMFYASGTSTSATISDIMINAGNVAMPYEPYKTPQSAHLSTPNGLAGLKVSSGGNYTDASGQQWICDEIVRNERGTGKLIQRIGRSKVADNTLYLTTLSNGNKALVVSEVPNKIGAVTGALFTMAPIKAWGSADIDKTGSAYENTANFVIVGTPDDTLETLTSKYGNCEFLYVLETPVETNLSDEEIAVLSALHTYNPATTISNDAGCEMTAAYVTKYYQGVGDAMFYNVADNLTTEAAGTSVMDARQGKVLDDKIGALASQNTELSMQITNLSTQSNTLSNNIGTLSNLETVAKGSVVASINEVKSNTDDLTPTVLFDSSTSVASGTFTESIYNFERIRIYYKIRFTYGSVDIYTSILSRNDPFIDLIGFFNFNNYLGAHLYQVNLTDTAFDTVYAYQYFPPSTEKTDVGADDVRAIYRVEGYTL